MNMKNAFFQKKVPDNFHPELVGATHREDSFRVSGFLAVLMY
jgi:hypothetical protein